MLQTKLLRSIIASFEFEKIEHHIFLSFVENQKIKYLNSPIISKYLAKFFKDNELYALVSSINIRTIKELENYLELLIPERDRKINGAFFTPSYIVSFIINNVNPKNNSKCLDPSCGCGAFLLGLVNYYQNTFKKKIKRIVQENIFGADILEYNIHRSKLLLALRALQNDEILEEEDFNLVVQDSLRANWQKSFYRDSFGEFDKIVGNPPYVKFQDLSNENREFLTKYWKTIKNGTFNLYFTFFELGYKLLGKNGRLGYITPNNYFTSLAGESLREYFHQTKCITKIIDFKHQKIFNAQTYTAVTFLSKAVSSSIIYDRIKQDQEPKNFIKNINGSPNDLKDLNSKKWRLLKTAEQANIKIIETAGVPLKEIVNISVGVATLKDELYFVRGKKDSNYFAKTVDNKTFKIEFGVTRQIYKISDFKDQDDIYNNMRHIIYPYKIILGNPVPFDENEMSSRFPNCYEYFYFIRNKLEKRDKGKNSVAPFYAYGRSQGLTVYGKKILTPTFSRYPRFLICEDEEAMFCNGYALSFKDKPKEPYSLFNISQSPFSKVENIHVLSKILNSYIMYYYIAKTSVSIEGGYPCYQKNFIEKFTIPDFTKEEFAFLNLIIDRKKIDNFLIKKYQLNIPDPNLLL